VLEEFEKDEKFKKVLNQKLVSRLPK
jgi:hypothetical protein